MKDIYKQCTEFFVSSSECREEGFCSRKTKNLAWNRTQLRTIRGNIVTWRSKKPNEVARSSAEAEFSVMADGMNFFIKLEVKFFPTRVFRKMN